MTDETRQELIAEAIDGGRMAAWIIQEIADSIPEKEYTPELEKLFLNAESGIITVNLYALLLLRDDNGDPESINYIKKNATDLRQEYIEATIKDQRLPRFGKKFFIDPEAGEE